MLFRSNISDAITTLQPQTIVNLCYAGNTSYCSLLSFNGAGVPTDVNLTSINAAQLKETGVDIESSYLLPLSKLGLSSNGSLRFRALINNVQTLKQFNGATTADFAGDVGGNNPYGLPKWRANANITFEDGPLAVDLADRFIGSGNYDNLNPMAYNVNRIPSINYVNLAIEYTAPTPGFENMQYFLKINNLFNKYPPIDPQQFFANIQTNPTLYDVVGRMFYLGVRFKVK